MTEQSMRLDMAMGRAARTRRQFAATPVTAAEQQVSVVIVGAGPVGLALAADFRQQGVSCVVLEKHDGVSQGSRAICWAKRTLEICDRLGVATRMVNKGITWNLGKVFAGAAPEPLYSFDLQPVKDQKFPAFINLQQYYTEEYFIDALADESPIRWQHRVESLQVTHDGVRLTVAAPDTQYCLHCDWLIAADGSRSTVRELMGLDFAGRTFEDNFLIADVRMKAPFPAERRFWFNAPFNEGRTALMHQQPDNVWRLDFQLGGDIDRAAAVREENVTRRVRAMLGPEIDFDYEWVSLYTFQCRRMTRFVHDRVIFAGDAAHLVSPFGARGANGGLQDADNLAWKLARVIKGEANHALLESYNEERVHAADQNLLNSTRSTDFMTPKSPAERALQQAVVGLAKDHPFARAFVNSGRLSVPCHQRSSSLTTPDENEFAAALQPGDVCLDAPLASADGRRWLLEHLGGRFVCLYFVDAQTPAPATVAATLPAGVVLLPVSREARADAAHDATGVLSARYDARPGTTCLIRPDQHLAARWRQPDPPRIAAALRRATAISFTQN